MCEDKNNENKQKLKGIKKYFKDFEKAEKKIISTRLKIFSIIFILTLAMDQISKIIVTKTMGQYETKSILKGIIDLTFVYNRGFMLGKFSHLNDGTTFNGVVIITIISLILLIGYFLYVLFDKYSSKYLIITFSILLGGAWGNFLDRIIRLKVVDFINLNFKIINISSIVNLADVFVTIAIVMLLIYFIFLEKYDNKKRLESITQNTEETSPIKDKDSYKDIEENENQ